MHATNHARGRAFHRVASLIAITSAAACGGDGIAGPVPTSLEEAAFGVVGAEIDLNGSWDWTETTVIKLRALAVPLFGIQAEGPITHITCQAWGTLDIAQVGASFTGMSTQQGACETKGGQPVVAPFPPTLDLIDGEIIGRSYRFTFDAGPFPLGGHIFCPNHGSIRVRNGVAYQLRGAGDCLLPGEKEFGHDFTQHFRADRN